MAARFDTRKFKASHMREPRGYGNWIFAPSGMENDESLWVSVTDTYSAARQAAAARMPNVTWWTVMP